MYGLVMDQNDATRRGRARGNVSWPNSVIFALALWFGVTGHAAPPSAGVAPVISPAGGFSIDGDLLANAPGANAGDWLLSTNAGSGGAVLDAAGR